MGYTEQVLRRRGAYIDARFQDGVAYNYKNKEYHFKHERVVDAQDLANAVHATFSEVDFRETAREAYNFMHMHLLNKNFYSFPANVTAEEKQKSGDEKIAYFTMNLLKEMTVGIAARNGQPERYQHSLFTVPQLVIAFKEVEAALDEPHAPVPTALKQNLQFIKHALLNIRDKDYASPMGEQEQKFLQASCINKSGPSNCYAGG